MHTGLATIFQSGGGLSDTEVYRHELALADLAEPLGFDSVWAAEHHFTDYTMCPDVLQFLTYMAGRTTRVQLGSMVVVLPWHDPVRVAEDVSVLDAMSGGRFILGIGRGLGRIEFDGFRVPMDESRERFVEAAEIVLAGLEEGQVKYDGKYFQQPRRDIRPRPAATFKGRTYAAAISPESSRIMAELGVGLLIIPQKPWEHTERDLAAYRDIYREVNNAEAPAPVLVCWVFCDEDPARAAELGELYIGNYYESVLSHYELHTGHLVGQKGYEYYANMSYRLKDQEDAGRKFFVDLQVAGTPDQCFDKIMDLKARTGCGTFVAAASYGTMPYDEAERNLRCIASQLRPRLQAV